MNRMTIGISLIVTTLLLTGWKESPVTLEQSGDDQVSSPAPAQIRVEKIDPEALLGEKNRETKEKLESTKAKTVEFETKAKVFRAAFDDDQSVALSSQELGLEFAGKDWFGRGETKRMDIQVRLANRGDGESIRSVILEIDIYRAGHETPIATSTRWLASSYLGLEPSTAAVRSIRPMSEDPFTRPELIKLNDRDIHLVIRPVEIRYRSKRVELEINRPDLHLAAIKAEIRSLEKQLVELEQARDTIEEKQVAATGTADFPADG